MVEQDFLPFQSVLEGPPRWDVILISGPTVFLAFLCELSTRVLTTANCYGKKQESMQNWADITASFHWKHSITSCCQQLSSTLSVSQIEPMTHKAELPSIALPSQAVWDHMGWFTSLRLCPTNDTSHTGLDFSSGLWA